MYEASGPAAVPAAAAAPAAPVPGVAAAGAAAATGPAEAGQAAVPPAPAPVSVPRLAWLIGPALVAGVAYLDPGNVASNMTAGAPYGFLLAWVVGLAQVMAGLASDPSR